MPVRKAFRYFPYLAQWQMQRIMVFPWLGYVSHFTHSASLGTVMAYDRTSIVASDQHSNILKIHGQGWYDLYIQVADSQALEIWQECFEPCDPQDEPVSLPDSSSHDVLLLPLPPNPSP